MTGVVTPVLPVRLLEGTLLSEVCRASSTPSRSLRSASSSSAWVSSLRTLLQLACTIGSYMETCGTEQSPCECVLVQLSYAIGDRMEGFDLGAGFCKRTMVQLSYPR